MVERDSTSPSAGIRIDGTFNSRDIGGHATSDGRTMSAGQLFRSASLDTVGDQGRADLAQLGVRAVLDLRTDHEIERSGRFDPGDSGIAWHHMRSPFGPPTADPKLMSEMLRYDDPMAEIYKLMLVEGSPMLAASLRFIANDDLPLVLHCTSGKDRTGLVAAVVQRLCGVPLEPVLADYERSGDALTQVHGDIAARFPEMLEFADEAKLRRMSSTDRAWVLGAFETVGGIDALPDWLVSIGVSHGDQRAIRDRLVA